ncbi:MAG: hypothetical protein ACE5NW_12860 [Acidiferrobacterales bacterium]
MTVGESFFERIKKTRFDHLYDLPDCRAYYQTLAPLDYQNPAHTVPIARAALEEISRLRNVRAPWVVDFACGYGIVSALLRYDVDMHTVIARYSTEELTNADTQLLIDGDRQWYAARRRAGTQTRVAAIDISAKALEYGRRVGLYDKTFQENLEMDDPSPGLSDFLPDISLIIDTGAYGYIGETSFRRLLDAAGAPLPWIVTSPARVADSGPSLEVMQKVGLVVEQVPLPPFRHRRFSGHEEKEHAIAELKRKGIDPSGLEDTGFYFANVYIGRPRDECGTPLGELI